MYLLLWERAHVGHGPLVDERPEAQLEVSGNVGHPLGCGGTRFQVNYEDIKDRYQTILIFKNLTTYIAL